ncbi:NnrS family protein [Antarcticimicrobium luteum]|uniref:NnrS family protein n=1 Tax=Antarcticimicrobium luteum TaxID=2547397 RepID=A0A4R5VBQ8_9RHOB|nr:NnrS family protein [Antarcticimicrobium luteum]TDK49640.1 NnrS family protein [Antarcticimicrobium luteum]
MGQTTAEQMRRWRGPALFTFGFRPFFLFGALWAGLAMPLWIAMLSGALTLPSRFDPVSWHAHAFLFGYLGAVVAGFLLTAVPNWTGRLPVVGWHLAGLVALWGLGRVAVLTSALLPVWASVAADLAFPLVLGAVLLREIVAGRNWRNLIVLGLLAVYALANLLFHIEEAAGDLAAQGVGLRLGLASALMMIAVIGGRIVPSFTRNWLVRAGRAERPAAPMQRFDKLSLLAGGIGLALWVLWPQARLTGLGLLLVGALHLIRLGRWKGVRTATEPLVWVLHLAYAFVPLGALATGLAVIWPDLIAPAGVQHLWMAGALGLMTLAVMTRATLGHTGQALRAGPVTVAIYAGLILSVLTRFAAGIWPEMILYQLSGGLWTAAFLGFAVGYGPLLSRARQRG